MSPTGPSAIMIKTCLKGPSATALKQCTIYQKRSFLKSSKGPKEQTFLLTKTINAPVTNVYSVICDISEYHRFIPYCNESFVNKRNPVTGLPTEAGLRVGFQHYDEKYVCQIHCQRDPSDHCIVQADSLTHSLFDVLLTKWTICPHPSKDGVTTAELLLKFKFKFSLYNNVASIFGKSVTQHVMKSFERRIFMLMKQEAKARSSKKSQRAT